MGSLTSCPPTSFARDIASRQPYVQIPEGKGKYGRLTLPDPDLFLLVQIVNEWTSKRFQPLSSLTSRISTVRSRTVRNDALTHLMDAGAIAIDNHRLSPSRQGMMSLNASASNWQQLNKKVASAIFSSDFSRMYVKPELLLLTALEHCAKDKPNPQPKDLITLADCIPGTNALDYIRGLIKTGAIVIKKVDGGKTASKEFLELGQLGSSIVRHGIPLDQSHFIADDHRAEFFEGVVLDIIAIIIERGNFEQGASHEEIASALSELNLIPTGTAALNSLVSQGKLTYFYKASNSMDPELRRVTSPQNIYNFVCTPPTPESTKYPISRTLRRIDERLIYGIYRGTKSNQPVVLTIEGLHQQLISRGLPLTSASLGQFFTDERIKLPHGQIANIARDLSTYAGSLKEGGNQDAESLQ